MSKSIQISLHVCADVLDQSTASPVHVLHLDVQRRHTYSGQTTAVVGFCAWSTHYHSIATEPILYYQQQTADFDPPRQTRALLNRFRSGQGIVLQ